MTGSDEHGQKIAEAAANEVPPVPPIELCNRSKSLEFRATDMQHEYHALQLNKMVQFDCFYVVIQSHIQRLHCQWNLNFCIIRIVIQESQENQPFNDEGLSSCGWFFSGLC